MKIAQLPMGSNLMDREETKKENLDWYSSYVWFYDFATWKFRIRGTSVRRHQQNKIPSLSLSVVETIVATN